MAYFGLKYPGEFRELRTTIYELIYKGKIYCISCGHDFTDGVSIEFEEHDGGLYFSRYDEKFWVWITCHKCKYQAALWKFFNLVTPEEFGIERDV